MANQDSSVKILTVALLLCIVCSVIVSTAAVLLKPQQVLNKSLDFKRNILAAAGLLEEGKTVEEQFAQVTTRVVDLQTGKYTDAVTADDYDQRKAQKDSTLSRALDSSEDMAKISRLENFVKVYIINDQNGIDKIILPIRGYGLWSTLRGFIALEADFNTVAGLGYYEHAETPGLGGEVDNPSWKGSWVGKKIYDAQGGVELQVIKGKVTSDTPKSEYKIDGLSGATLTARGVSNMISFWMGKSGYAPYLQNLKSGDA